MRDASLWNRLKHVGRRVKLITIYADESQTSPHHRDVPCSLCRMRKLRRSSIHISNSHTRLSDGERCAKDLLGLPTPLARAYNGILATFFIWPPWIEFGSDFYLLTLAPTVRRYVSVASSCNTCPCSDRFGYYGTVAAEARAIANMILKHTTEA